jgi:hypothetical protein
MKEMPKIGMKMKNKSLSFVSLDGFDKEIPIRYRILCSIELLQLERESFNMYVIITKHSSHV